MAAKGFYLVQGDRTTCGGRITTGAEDHTLFDKPVARSRTASLAESTQGYTRLPVASTTIPFMAGEWPEPSTALVLAPVRRGLFHQ